MSNDFYNESGSLIEGEVAQAADITAELQAIESGFTAAQEQIYQAIKLTSESETQEITENAVSRANKVVGFDANGALALRTAGATYKGNYSAGTYYRVNDIVKDAAGAEGLNNLYISNEAFTAADLATEVAAGKWTLFVDVEDVENAQIAAEAAQAAAETAEANAETAEALAEKWASEAVDVEVESGKYSAYHWAQKALGADALDHGNLEGLADDDHSQYHTDARGDARYYTQAQLNGGQLDSRYYTEAEVTSFLSGKLANVVEDTTPQLGGALDGNSKKISGVRGFQFDSVLDNGTKSANFSIDLGAANKQTVTIGAAGLAMAFTSPAAPCSGSLEIRQDATGNRTITSWPTIYTPGGGASGWVLSTGANSIDTLYWEWTGSILKGSLVTGYEAS